MLSKINNSNFQKNANISLVSQLIWLNKGITRAEIARSLNLYRSTVTNICDYLIENGVVIEGETGASCPKGGRKPVQLMINKDFGSVIGINIQPSHYRIVLLNILGDSLWEESASTPDMSFEELIVYLMERAKAEQVKTGLPLLGVCFGLPGVIDREKGLIKYSEPLKIEEFSVYEFFRLHFDVPVLIENDANCCAWYELIKEKGELESGSFLSVYGDFHENINRYQDFIGIGIGIGIAINGSVYRGSHCSAGEFCSTSWRGGENKSQTGMTPEMLNKIHEDKSVWKQWMKETFDSFIPLIAVFDPERIYLLGNPFENEEEVMEMLKEISPGILDVAKRYGCKFIFDTSDERVVARGAAMMYLKNLFSVPELNGIGSALQFDWHSVIARTRR